MRPYRKIFCMLVYRFLRQKFVVKICESFCAFVRLCAPSRAPFGNGGGDGPEAPEAMDPRIQGIRRRWISPISGIFRKFPGISRKFARFSRFPGQSANPREPWASWGPQIVPRFPSARCQVFSFFDFFSPRAFLREKVATEIVERLQSPAPAHAEKHEILDFCRHER
jgi:hypothetical protein